MPTLAGNITESEAISTWRVTATKCKDGTLAGTTTTTGSSYTITTADTDPCNITLAPKIDYAWSAAKGVTLNDYVVAANPDAMPHLWQATAVTGDPYYNQVSLLLHCDGTNGSTTFTDNSPNPKTMTANGNVQVSTAQSQFGGASALFDGSGDKIRPPLSADFAYGTGAFTIEMFVRPTSFTSTGGEAPIAWSQVRSGDNYCVLGLTTAGKLYFNYGTGGGTSIVSTASLALNTWTHIAVSRQGTGTGQTILFIAGAVDTVSTCTFNFTDTTVMLPCIGGAAHINGPAAFSQDYIGNIDEIRITKGVARYTAAFTPPAAAHQDVLSATGAAEPSWNLSGTTTDNAVTWTYVAPLVDPKTLGPKIPS